MCTKFPEAIPRKDISTSRVAEVFLEIFSHVGLTDRIHSDRGSQFTSEMMSEVYRLLNVKQSTITPYHGPSTLLLGGCVEVPARCSPCYLADLCVPAHSVHGRQQLRTTASGTLLVPRARTATGQRSFAINGPRTWNSLPADLRTPDTTLCFFKRHLKAHLFQQ